jgi:hypothetical protein
MNRRNLAKSAFGQEWLTPGMSTSRAPLISASEAAYAWVVSGSRSVWMIVTSARTLGKMSSRCRAMADAKPQRIRGIPARDQSGTWLRKAALSCGSP